jgi:hypothetical protein
MKTLLIAVTALAFVAAPAAAATLAGPSTTSYLTTSHGGVRFRAFGAPTQQEVFLGVTSLGVPANRAAQNLTWLSGANTFTFSYDANTDTLTSIVNTNPALNYGNFFANLSPAKQALPINRLQIQAKDLAVGAGSISISDLVLNGNPLLPGTLSVPEDNINRYWATAGNFNQSFTLTGKINLSGTFFGTGAEGNRVEVTLGNAVPEPSSWAMMIAGFGLTGATLRRQRRFKTLANA